MYLICVNNSAPHIAGAKFVVSERGDILSPKYAPEIIAPAVSPAEIPNAVPIASSAIPIVAMVDQELQVARDTIAQIMQEAKRKISGLKIVKQCR